MKNEFVCGDNCDVMVGMEPESVQLFVTSPPYDSLKKYAGVDGGWDFYGCAWLMARLLKEGGAIVWVVNDQVVKGSESGTSFEQALHFKALGLRLHDTMIYQKSGGGNLEKARYYQGFDYAFVFSKGKPKFNAIVDRKNVCVVNRADEAGERKKFGTRYNVWRYANGGHHNGGKSHGGHPAPMPAGLARDHILSWSDEGDFVVDPFCGSGTTCLEAAALNREWLGIDVSDDYCRLSAQRMEIQRASG